MEPPTQTNPWWRTLAPTLIRQIVVPVVAYQLLHHNGVSAVDSLSIIAGGSAILLVAGWIYRRATDPLGLFILGAIVLGIVAALITGDPRVQLLRDSVFTGGFGLVYLGSLFIGRPITFHFGRKFAGVDEERWDDMWDMPDFRRAHTLMTSVWGVCLVVEAAVRVVLVFTLPVSLMQDISAPIAGVVIAALAYWSVLYGKRMRQRGLERRGLVETPDGQVVPKSGGPAAGGPSADRIGAPVAGRVAAAPTDT